MSFVCGVCESSFSTKSNLNRHLKNVHEVDVPSTKLMHYKCNEGDCPFASRECEELMSHLEKSHDFSFKTEKISFRDIEEFAAWKTVTEQENNSRYIKSIKKKTPVGHTTYFYCNRSWKGKAARSNDKVYKRQEKAQGTCKLEFNCTSTIKLLEGDDKTVSCLWQQNHYGHLPDLKHIRIHKEDRQAIASKMVIGVPTVKVLEGVRDNMSQPMKRVDMLTLKDVGNIKCSHNIDNMENGKRNNNDAVSVDLWVQEKEQETYNPVLFYKKQGLRVGNFKLEDFCLVVMTEIQSVMLKDFGHNIIAIDSTHGLNGYDFDMSTLMVVDEFNQGFPVAFMFCNKKDTYSQTVFVETIRDKVGIITAKTFMSDLDPTFYNAWVNTMGATSHTLFCSWHVDRAWQSNLSKISNKTKQSAVYTTIKVLQQETSLEDFLVSLDNAILIMLEDPETEAFGVYFKNNYYSNYKKWAYCHRAECGINTNMFLESMHKVIKYFYLNRRTVKRLDKGLCAVLKYVRDKSVERVIKLVKGKCTLQSRLTFNRHNSAIIADYTWEETDDDKLQLFTDSTMYDIVKVQNSICCNNVCKICNICYHTYTCSCVDYTNKYICKHIHYVSRLSKDSEDLLTLNHGQTINNLDQLLPALTSGGSHEPNQLLPATSDSSGDSTGKVARKIYTQHLQKLLNVEVELIGENVIKQLNFLLKTATNLVDLPNVDDQAPVPTTKSKTCARTIQPQLRFSSTKNNKVNKLKLKKPEKLNPTQVSEIKKQLSGK